MLAAVFLRRIAAQTSAMTTYLVGYCYGHLIPENNRDRRDSK